MNGYVSGQGGSYDPYADDYDTCGWCGHEHPRDHDCGCAPCPDCDQYHTTDPVCYTGPTATL